MDTANDHDTPGGIGHDFPSSSCPGCGWFVSLCHCPSI